MFINERFTLDLSRSDITRYCIQHHHNDNKMLVTLGATTYAMKDELRGDFCYFVEERWLHYVESALSTYCNHLSSTKYVARAAHR